MTSTSFPIPPSVEQKTSGAEPSTTGEKSEPTSYSLEELLTDLNLMPRKRGDARHKAMRLLIAGRLTVLRKEGNLVVAKCKGDHGKEYDLGFDPRNSQWRCTCEAKGDCSHLFALWSVTAVNRG